MSPNYKDGDIFAVGSALAATGTTASSPIDIRKYLQFGYQYKVTAPAIGDAAAALTNQAVTYTADAAGTAGNALQIALVAPSADNATADVARSGNVFTITLAGTIAKFATGTVTISNYVALTESIPDSVTVAGVTFVAQTTAVVAGEATFRAYFTNTMTAQSLADQINAHVTSAASVTAAQNENVITITADASGTAGNSIGIAYTNNGSSAGATVSDANLTGGGLEILIEFSAEPIYGNWTLEYDGNQTNSMGFDVDASFIEGEIQGAGWTGFEEATVSGNYISGFTVFVAMNESDYLADGPIGEYANTLLSVQEAAAVGTLNLTADIVLTSVAAGTARNTTTFTTQVLAAAALPTDEIHVVFSGTAAAIVCTITPNDGTNNVAGANAPVVMRTESLREIITTGAAAVFAGSGDGTLVLTDASSLRILQTATGGSGTNMTDAGEGDGVVATFAAGADDVGSTISVDDAELVPSTGQVSITSYAILAGDIISIGGVDFTAQTAAVVAGEATFRSITSNAATATSLAAQINAHAVASLLVEATANTADVDLEAVDAGFEGDSTTLVYTNTGTTVGASVSAATLLTGAAAAITSTATSLVAAFNAASITDAAITASGSGSSALVALAATNLASGTDTTASLTGTLQLQVSCDNGYEPGSSVPAVTNWSNSGSSIALTAVDASGVSAAINSGALNATWVRLLYTASGSDDAGVIQSRFTAKR